MIAKIIVYDTNREAAIQRMLYALGQTVILGTITNLPFLRALLRHPVFVAGNLDTGFIDAHLSDLLPPEDAPPDVALITAALSERIAGERLKPSPTQTDGDLYSPWERTDSFRLGAGSSI
jgi:3-methylcrotonyl-CoA carboxylase alpha subunit